MADKIRLIVRRPTGSGKRVGWNKLVTGVDRTQTGGFAFLGNFLNEKQMDLSSGDVLVGQIPVGSARSGLHWRVGVVTTNGVAWEDRTWPPDRFLDFGDHVENLVREHDSGIEALKKERAQLLERVRNLDLLIEQEGQKEE